LWNIWLNRQEVLGGKNMQQIFENTADKTITEVTKKKIVLACLPCVIMILLMERDFISATNIISTFKK
jgi:hypothetical protein